MTNLQATHSNSAISVKSISLVKLIKQFVDKNDLEQVEKHCADINVNGLQLDNRQLKSGDGFVAYQGHANDGRNYIKQAIEIAEEGVVVLYPPFFPPPFLL